MALAPIATAADLAARGIRSDFDQVDIYLDSAAAAVRSAAGSPISKTTSTVTLDGYAADTWLALPGPPVTDAIEVKIDGDTVDDWRLANGRLWRAGGWGTGWLGRPSPVEVTYTHGLEHVPEDIIDLVCSMVAAAKSALDTDPDGLGLEIDNGRVQSVSIDGFTEAYATSGDAIEAVTALTLPPRTRRWLAARFGGSTGMVTSR